MGWPGCLFAKAEGLKNPFFVLLDRIGAVFPRLIFHNIMYGRTLEAGILALNLEHRPNYAPRLPSSRLIPPDQMTRSQKRRWQRRNLMARRMGGLNTPSQQGWLESIRGAVIKNSLGIRSPKGNQSGIWIKSSPPNKCTKLNIDGSAAWERVQVVVS